jgi:hypothetical protein
MLEFSFVTANRCVNIGCLRRETVNCTVGLKQQIFYFLFFYFVFIDFTIGIPQIQEVKI